MSPTREARKNRQAALDARTPEELAQRDANWARLNGEHPHNPDHVLDNPHPCGANRQSRRATLKLNKAKLRGVSRVYQEGRETQAYLEYCADVEHAQVEQGLTLGQAVANVRLGLIRDAGRMQPLSVLFRKGA